MVGLCCQRLPAWIRTDIIYLAACVELTSNFQLYPVSSSFHVFNRVILIDERSIGIHPIVHSLLCAHLR